MIQAYMPARSLAKDGGVNEHFAPRDVCDALHTSSGNSGNKAPLLAEVAHTIRAEGHDASEDGTGRGPPLTIDAWTGDREVADPVSAAEMKTYTHEGNNFRLHNCVSERPRGRVRRLTVLECEKLQGFPPGHTLIQTSRVNHKDPEMIAYLRRQRPDLTDAEIAKLAADGPRYKAIGNSMAVNVMRWIGLRIENNRTP